VLKCSPTVNFHVKYNAAKPQISLLLHHSTKRSKKKEIGAMWVSGRNHTLQKFSMQISMKVSEFQEAVVDIRFHTIQCMRLCVAIYRQLKLQ
jgi:hypothetical protein